MKDFTILLSVLVLIVFIPYAFADSTPDWVKNTAGWWATDAISEIEFINAIEFLVDVGIIQVTSTTTSITDSESVPKWIKNTAGWWATDAISDAEFINAIEFLVGVGIINISNECKFENKEFSHITEIGKMILCKKIDMTFLDEIVLSEKRNEELRINKYGFRGDNFSAEKPENTFRIFIVGSSVAYGQHTLEKDSISSHLQKFYDEKNLETEIEVINAGFGNAWSKTEVKWIKENIINFEPDLIIVLDGWTDVTRELVKNEDWESDANVGNWISRWNDLCEFGNNNEFNTIITIQPILGSSNRMFTNQESMEFQHHPYQQSHLDLLEKYAENLEKLESTCANTADLTNVYDGYFFPIYLDLGHVNSFGSKVIANEFFKLSIPMVLQDEEKFLSDIEIPKFHSAEIKNSEDDMSGMIFSNMELNSLENKRFWWANLHDIEISNSEISNNDFRFSHLNEVDFQGSELENTNIIRSLIDGSDFSFMKISDANFSTTNIVNTNFDNSVLKNIVSYGGVIQENSFTNSIIKDSLIKSSIISNNDFSNAKFENIQFESIVLAGSNFSGVDFGSTQFNGGTDFSAKFGLKENEPVRGATLQNSDFRETNLKNVKFSLVSLENDVSEERIIEINNYRENYAVDASFVNFSNLDLANKNFIAMNFKFSNMSFTDLTNSDLRYSDLSGANLEGANLEGANLEGANLEGANLKCINHIMCE